MDNHDIEEEEDGSKKNGPLEEGKLFYFINSNL